MKVEFSTCKVQLFREGHKIKVKISQKFMAFSEYMNFNGVHTKLPPKNEIETLCPSQKR